MDATTRSLPIRVCWRDFAPKGESTIDDQQKQELWETCPDEFKHPGNQWRQYAEHFSIYPSPIQHWEFKPEVIERDRVREILLKLISKEISWRHEHRYPVLGWWLSLILKRPPDTPGQYIFRK